MNGAVADAKELFWLAGGALAGLAAWVGWVLATAETRKGPMVPGKVEMEPAKSDKAPEDADAEARLRAAGSRSETAGAGGAIPSTSRAEGAQETESGPADAGADADAGASKKD